MIRLKYLVLPLIYLVIGSGITFELLRVILDCVSLGYLVLLVPMTMLTILLTVIGIVNIWVQYRMLHNDILSHIYNMREMLWLYFRCWLVLVCGIILSVVFYWLHDLLPETIRELTHSLYIFFFIICGFLTLSALLSIIWREDLKEIRLNNAENENQLLKAQLNPHFLYNTLNNIDALVWLDQERASQAVTSLSDLMRYLTYSSRQEQVSIGEEVVHLQQLVDLERLRINNPNAISFEVAMSDPKTKISPLLMIPLIENCFKHCGNLGEDDAIKMELREEGGKLIFKTENNIRKTEISESPKSPVKNKSGVGLSVLRRRLALLYPHRHSLTGEIRAGRYVATLIVIF